MSAKGLWQTRRFKVSTPSGWSLLRLTPRRAARCTPHTTARPAAVEQRVSRVLRVGAQSRRRHQPGIREWAHPRSRAGGEGGRGGAGIGCWRCCGAHRDAVAQVESVLVTDLTSGEFQLEFTDMTVYKLLATKGAREASQWVDELERRIAWAAAEKAKRGDDDVEAWGTGRGKGRGDKRARGGAAAAGGRGGGGHARSGSAGGRRRRGDDDDDDEDGDAPAPARAAAGAGVGRGGSTGRGGFMSPAGKLDGVSEDEDATPSGRHGRGHGPRPSLMPRSGGRDSDAADSDAEPPAAATTSSRGGTRAGAGAAAGGGGGGGGSLAAAYASAAGGGTPAPAPAPKPVKPKAPPAPTRKGVVSQAAVTRLGKSQTWYMELRNGYLHLSK